MTLQLFSAWISSVRGSCYPPSLVIFYLCIIIILVCIGMAGVWKSDDNGGSWLSPSNMSILGTELSASALAPVSRWLSSLSGLGSLSFLNLVPVNFSEPRILTGLL